MAVRVAVVWRIAGAPVVVDAGERVRNRSGADRVDRNLYVAVGAVLEADRHRKARAQLAVDLTLRRARANRPPGDRVRDVLRGDRVQELAADRKVEVEHLEEKGPATRRPALTSPELSRWGSLMRPFQPVVVRGFSK